MTSEDGDGVQRKGGRPHLSDSQRYIFKPLLRNIRLASDDVDQKAYIKCVEYWSMCIMDELMP